MIGLPYCEKTVTIMLSRFHPIPERDGRTDGRTDRRTEFLYQYRASVCWRAIKIVNIWRCWWMMNFLTRGYVYSASGKHQRYQWYVFRGTVRPGKNVAVGFVWHRNFWRDERPTVTSTHLRWQSDRREFSKWFIIFNTNIYKKLEMSQRGRGMIRVIWKLC